MSCMTGTRTRDPKFEMRKACREILQKSTIHPDINAESPYVTYRMKISAPSALSSSTSINLAFKEGGSSRILSHQELSLLSY